MESGKMVLMKRFAGQEQRLRHRDQTCGQQGKERVGGTESNSEICTLACVKQIATGKLLYRQGAQPAAL